MGMLDIWFWPFMILGGVLAVIIGLLVFAFWIWMIIDCARRNFKNNVEKIVWILVIIFAGWVGALIYFFVIKSYNRKGLAKK